MKVIRITTEVLDFDPVTEKETVDTGFEPIVTTMMYTDIEKNAVYEDADELGECITRIATAG